MKEIIKTLKDYGVGLYDEKRSHFVACSASVHSEQEALDFIQKIKGWHKRATHYVYVYLFSDENDIVVSRYSDDKEPQGTAGIPVLDFLKSQKLENAAVVIARYYGGIPLGASNLTRAYRKVAGMAVRNSGTTYMVLYDDLFVSVDYTVYEKVRHLLYSNTREDLMILKHKVLGEEFGETVEIHMYSAVNDTEKLCKLLKDAACGKISFKIEYQKGRYYL